MRPQPYRFVIDDSVPLAEAEMSLQLAMIALEGLFGQARVRLEARYQVDPPRRALLVDVSTPVGAAVARVFASLLIREFGDDSFTVAGNPGLPLADAAVADPASSQASEAAAA